VRFILVGDRTTVTQGCHDAAVDLKRTTILHAGTSRDALAATIDQVRSGAADMVLKGSLDTGTLMRALLDEKSGIRKGRLLSDVFLFEYPRRTDNRFIMITDGGLNPAPDLADKVALIANAVLVAHALGNRAPKVAVLAASEFVSSGMPATVDAAALSKMNERGQIAGCVVDGPLALDNAISEEAVKEKSIESQVAGRAEILLAPNIETANALAKSTTFFAEYRLAHVIVGGTVPILIPSRADRSDAKLLSIALGMIVRHRNAEAAE
jgi:phosphate butyryltransferase